MPTQGPSRLWSIRIGRDQYYDWNVSCIFEVQEKNVAPGAADRNDTRAVGLGVEEEWCKRQRYALLVVLAAVQRRVWTVVARALLDIPRARVRARLKVVSTVQIQFR